jgi:hypothetical protein
MRRIPLLAMLWLLVACATPPPPSASPVSTPTPTPTAVPTPTPSPTPTPVPTPIPSLPPLDVSVFEPGWTLAATDSNEGPEHESTILSTIGSRYSVAVVCVGDGELTVTLHAAGGALKADHPSGMDAGAVTVECPSLTPTVTAFDGSLLPDWHGVLVSATASGPQHLRYRTVVGTAGPG